ncbi:MAG TPA: hypothetical protein VE983_03890 [Solirubrobacteraceae bacterium]|nr:hypothetical protein [Solirubrobacteraceae bacterium]
MNRSARMLVCLAATLGLVLAGAGPALAGGGSAGNSQYVDPLSGHGHHHSSSQGSSAGSSSSSTTTTTTTSSGSGNSLTTSPPSSVGGSSSTSSSASGTSSTSHHDPPHLSRTLPYTGLNVWACALLGAMLLAAGAVLRRGLPQGE